MSCSFMQQKAISVVNKFQSELTYWCKYKEVVATVVAHLHNTINCTIMTHREKYLKCDRNMHGKAESFMSDKVTIVAALSGILGNYCQ